MHMKSGKKMTICAKGHMLNLIVDNIYKLYSNTWTARELWKILDKKYKTEKFGAKKYVVGWYLNFKIIDDKPILLQVHELQTLVHEIVK